MIILTIISSTGGMRTHRATQTIISRYKGFKNSCSFLSSCPGCLCPFNYKPVCGENGKSYGNACEAGCVGVKVEYKVHTHIYIFLESTSKCPIVPSYWSHTKMFNINDAKQPPAGSVRVSLPSPRPCPALPLPRDLRPGV